MAGARRGLHTLEPFPARTQGGHPSARCRRPGPVSRGPRHRLPAPHESHLNKSAAILVTRLVGSGARPRPRGAGRVCHVAARCYKKAGCCSAPRCPPRGLRRTVRVGSSQSLSVTRARICRGFGRNAAGSNSSMHVSHFDSNHGTEDWPRLFPRPVDLLPHAHPAGSETARWPLRRLSRSPERPRPCGDAQVGPQARSESGPWGRTRRPPFPGPGLL